MASRERRLDRGNQRADQVARTTGAEVRLIRMGAGLSLRSAASSVAMSETTFGRIERGKLANVSLRQLSLACAAVGLKFVARPYPDGTTVRDAGQVRLLGRLRQRLPHEITWRTEVAVPIPGDLRAWDAQITVGNQVVGVEAEMRLFDLQALDRRISLKRRDSGIGIVVLLVADTQSNRRLLAQYREALRANFPLDGRAILAALSAGRAPRASGVLVL